MDFDILAGRWAQMFSKARQWFRRPGRIGDELKEVRKRILIEYGESYAVKQLEATEDYFRTVRLTIGPKIKAKLTWWANYGLRRRQVQSSSIRAARGRGFKSRRPRHSIQSLITHTPSPRDPIVPKIVPTPGSL